jgi:polar amino acid transport system permease protein
MTGATSTPARTGADVTAIPVRHPGRWVASAVVLLLSAMFVHMLVTNPAFQWSFIRDNAFSAPVINGAKNTLVLTVLSMVIGVLLGIVLAVMRLSPNPVLSGGAWVYVWFFRAVPRVVLLILFGNLGVLYARYDIGIPFDRQIAALTGLSFDGRFFGVSANTILTAFVAALLGLALSEAAYMAEIVRAGISSIDEGQTEAAQALGMSRGRLMRRIVLPQAMRVIVPPTGNETIAMIKDTSLVAFVPYYELFFQLQSIGARTFQLFPMLVAACLWYLAMTSVLMVGQHYLERYFARGASRHMTARQHLQVDALEHLEPPEPLAHRLGPDHHQAGGRLLHLPGLLGHHAPPPLPGSRIQDGSRDVRPARSVLRRVPRA